jgi:hypothetical protein
MNRREFLESSAAAAYSVGVIGWPWPLAARCPITASRSTTCLFPYRIFKLPTDGRDHLQIAHLIVGPTPHVHQAVSAVQEFVSRQGAGGFISGVDYCDIPLREA